jgi:hypothetical protein
MRVGCTQSRGGAAFADTQPLFTDGDAFANESLKLFRCGCASSSLALSRRTGWMRLLPHLRLYKCRECGARVLRSELRHGSYAVLGYLPAFYRPSAAVQRLQATAQVAQVILERGWAARMLMLGTTLRTADRQRSFAETQQEVDRPRSMR